MKAEQSWEDHCTIFPQPFWINSTVCSGQPAALLQPDAAKYSHDQQAEIKTEPDGVCLSLSNREI